VCLRVRGSDYAELFRSVWGADKLDCVKDVRGTYERIARSIAAFERSDEVNPFSSKFDRFWDDRKGKMPPVQMINMRNKGRFGTDILDARELLGLAVFNDATKGNCSACHFLMPMHGSEYPLFTDFRYHNLGIPKNASNPFYAMEPKWNPAGAEWVDLGLGDFLLSTDGEPAAHDFHTYSTENFGKHRTPTLRNVNKRPDDTFVKAYAHNGFFKSLEQIVHFYNVRDVPCGPGQPMMCWPGPGPEHPENVSDLLGDLRLTQEEGMALIAFLKTLDDGYVAPSPP
jgi:cytochrome c peroxidase